MVHLLQDPSGEATTDAASVPACTDAAAQGATACWSRRWI